MADDDDSATPEHRFGQAVRRAREDRGWSQEVLAAELAGAGLNVGGQSGVARIERGVRPTRLNEVVQIADFLVIDTEEIYGSLDRLDSGDVESAEAHLLEVLQAEDDARAGIADLQVDIAFFQQTLRTLERKHARLYRTLERAGVDVMALYTEYRTGRDQAEAEAQKAGDDGER